MYRVTVERSFVAQHFLTVPDPGPEGEVHSHRFTAEVGFEGPELDEFGYLVDIDAVKAATTTVVDRYRDTTLNDHEPFAGENPSVERFARIFCEAVVAEVDADVPERARVKLWEDDEAWASYETAL
ncbi:6-pyruvoyltetrahydropterin/6-carboxytetrahydropterin synthase [Halogranum amylolyticum]|uniref:6-pyruvoyltetrahydropterin/6-carboxytetrahydropterin synthase n=1 Tax=Halogranum amylolyticum TaxID=660520 RepID=A0A1H8SG85_9EURY|nr:6-carboxytetrahydropterin synthase [Halogranum amylolyticum]SEO77526.1 6-pyruvoyltetrahydropterin/6-carboxytetrahydropterin synthase [Halogranum amylolyticum]